MATTNRRALNLPSTFVYLDDDYLAALLAMITSRNDSSLAPVVSLRTETADRLVDEKDVASFLRQIADIPRPLKSLEVSATFSDAGRIVVELSAIIAKVTATGPLLEWVQKKPGEIEIWFRSDQRWYSPVPVPIWFLLSMIALIVLILFGDSQLGEFYLITPPHHNDKLNGSQTLFTIVSATIVAFFLNRIQSLFPKATIINRPTASARIDSRTTAISTAILAVAAVVTLVFYIYSQFHAASH
jgi:hypothetical protein